MAVTESMVYKIEIDTQKTQDNLDAATKTTKILDDTLLKMIDSLSGVSDELDKLTSILSSSFEKGIISTKQLSGNINIMSESVNLAGKEVKNFNVDLDKNQMAIDQVNQSVGDTSGYFSAFGNTINNTISIVQAFTGTIFNLVSILDFLTDPGHIKMLADLANILAAMASLKGFSELGDRLRETGDRLDDLAVKGVDWREKSKEMFKENIDKARDFNATLDALGNTLGTLVGGGLIYGVAKWAYTFKAVKEALIPLITNIQAVGTIAYKVGTIIKGSLHLSFLGLAEGASVASAPLMLLGSYLKESESSIVRFAGKVLWIAGIIAGGFATAVGVVISYLGSFIEKIGDKLINSMTASEEKFIKFEKVMAQFTFTLQGFIRVFGEQMIGSLNFWNNELEKINKNTIYSREEIAKSIKLLIAEGKVIGFDAETNVKLLTRISDIASATGRDLYEVTQMIVSGLTNNADAVLSLGIDIRNAALAHSDYVKASGLTLEQMNVQELAMARLNALYERTTPLIGSATKATETISGINAIYEKSMDNISVKLGETGTATRAYLIIINKIAVALSNLPSWLLGLIGNIKDLIGVVLKVTGTIIKWLSILFMLATVFKLVTIAIASFLGVQLTLVGVLGSVTSALAPYIIALTSLWFAYKSLIETSPAFADTINEIKSVFTSTDNEVENTTESISIFQKAWESFLDIIKMSMTGLALLINQLAIGMIQLKKIFTDDNDAIQIYDEQIFDLEKRIAGLIETNKKLGYEFLLGNVAYAAEPIKETAKVIDQQNDQLLKFKDRVVKLAKEINSSFNVDIERQKILGDEYKKALMTYKQSQDELNNVFKMKASEKEVAQKYAELEKASLTASFELEKLRLDTIKKFKDETRMMNVEALKNQGRNIEAIREETKIRLEELARQEAGLKSLGQLTIEQQNQINTYRKAIKASEQAAIYQEQRKHLEKITDLQKQIGEIQRESLGYDQNAILDLRQKISSRKDELNQIERQLKASNDLSKKAKDLLEIGRKSLDLSYKNNLIKMQKDLAKETISLEIELLSLYGDELNIYKMQSQVKIDELNTKIQNMNLVDNQTEAEKAITNEYLKQLEILKKTQAVNIYDIQAKQLGEFGQQVYQSTRKILASVKSTGASIKFDITESDTKNVASGLGENLFSSFKVYWNKGIDKITSPFDQSIESLSKFSLGFAKAADYLSQGFSIGYDFVSKILDADFITSIADSLVKFVDELPDALMKAFDSLLKSFEKFMDKLPETVNKLMDGLSEMLGRLFDKMPQMIEKLMDALTNFIQRLPEIFGKLMKALPEMIDSLLKKLPDVITAIFDAIPKMISQLLEAIPEIIKKILDRLPAIIESIIVGVFNAVADIIIMLIDFIFGGGLEKIIKAIIVAIPRIIGAIIMGVLRGLSDFINKLFGTGLKFNDEYAKSIEELPKKLETGVKKLSKTISKEASQVFKIMDMEAEAKALDRLSKAKSVTDVINIATELFAKRFKSLWQWLLEALDKIWTWVWEKILKPFIELLTKAWRWVWDHVLGPIVDKLTEVWRWVYDKIVQPMIDAISAVWQWVLDKILNPFMNALVNALNWIGENIFKPFLNGVKAVFEYVFGLFNNIITAITDCFNYISENIWKPFIQAIIDAWSWIRDNIWNWFTTALTNIWAWIRDNIWQVFIDALSGIWSWIKTNIWDVFIGALSGIWSWIKTNIWDVFINALRGAGDYIGGVLTSWYTKLVSYFSTFKDLIEKAWSTILQLFNGFRNIIVQAWQKILDIFEGANFGNKISSAWKGVIDFFSKFKWPEFKAPDWINKLTGGGGGGNGTIADVGDWIAGRAGWATGGLVNGRAKVPGDSLKNDVVPALLSPGEYIIPRSIASNPAILNLLQALVTKDPQKVLDLLGKQIAENIFKGKIQRFAFGGPVGSDINNVSIGTPKLNGFATMGESGETNISYNINMTLNIDAGSDNLDQTYIRTKLIPSIKEEFKKSSMRGEFLIADRGIRKL